MQIQVNTDGNVSGRGAFEAHVTAAIESTLGRFGDDVTRVEIHLGDESAGRVTAADKRCMIEARLAWRSPVTVTCHRGTLDEALTTAIGKLVTVLGREFDRRDHRKGAASIRTHSQPPEMPAAGDAETDLQADDGAAADFGVDRDLRRPTGVTAEDQELS